MKNIITFDFNNMMADAVESGLKKEELKEFEEMVPSVHKGVEAKRRENTWRELPYNQKEIVEDMIEEAKKINNNYDAFVVLGIGGSALGSKALFSALKHLKYNELPKEKRGAVRFYVADNVDPEGLNALFDVIDPKKTVFHVITKSGNTVETVTQFMLTLDLLKKSVGENFKDNIIITTDKENGNMKRIADKYGFKTYIVPDGVGGRFSVLCPVGLLSAAVLNIDIDALLKGAADMHELCMREKLSENPAYMYAMLYTAAMKKGVNISVMMPYADSLACTAEWYAQLWAESLGKRYNNSGDVVNCGQTPVRALGVTDQHSQVQLYTEGPFDKIITFIEVKNFRSNLAIPKPPVDVFDAEYLAGQSFNKLIASEMKGTEYAITKAGKMNMRISIEELNEYSYGALLMFFEMATAAAGEFLYIDAFNQPGVEEGKIATFALMGRQGYEEKAAELNHIEKKDSALIYSL